MSRSARLLVLVLAVLTALGSAACSSSTGSPTPWSLGHTTATLTDLNPTPIVAHAHPVLPVTVRGFDGAQVTVSDAGRIVAVDLYGTLAETVYALGLGDRLVGRGSSAAFPALEHLPDVTPNGASLNVEAVLALHPTVLLADSSAGSPAVIRQLRDAEVPVVMFDPAHTVAGVGAHIESVADALGVHNQGVALARRSMAEIDAAVAGIPAANPKLKIAFLYLRGTSITFLAGPGSGADSLIEALDAADVGTTVGLTAQFTPITGEAMAAATPDVLLVMTDGLASVGGVPALLKLPGVAQTPAGRHQRVVDIADTALLSFGPSTGRVLAALRAAVYGPTAGTPATAAH